MKLTDENSSVASAHAASVVRAPDTTIHRGVLFGAAITALGGLLFGYDTGVISGALLFVGRISPA